MLVRQLQVNGFGLSGTVPPTISALSQLAYLELDSNPGLTGSLPSTISGLTSLMYASGAHDMCTFWRLNYPVCYVCLNVVLCCVVLCCILLARCAGHALCVFGRQAYIQYDNFIGTLPSTLVTLTRLTNLAMCGNALSGELPTWVTAMANINNYHLTLGACSGGPSQCAPGYVLASGFFSSDDELHQTKGGTPACYYQWHVGPSSGRGVACWLAVCHVAAGQVLVHQSIVIQLCAPVHRRDVLRNWFNGVLEL